MLSDHLARMIRLNIWTHKPQSPEDFDDAQ